MRVLFDNGVPRGVAQALIGHAVEEARERGSDTLRNGDLLDIAEASGFDVFMTTDQNLRFQQNLANRRLAVVVLGKARWRLIRKMLARIATVVNDVTPGSYTEIDIPERRHVHGRQRFKRRSDVPAAKRKGVGSPVIGVG